MSDTSHDTIDHAAAPKVADPEAERARAADAAIVEALEASDIDAEVSDPLGELTAGEAKPSGSGDAAGDDEKPSDEDDADAKADEKPGESDHRGARVGQARRYKRQAERALEQAEAQAAEAQRAMAEAAQLRRELAWAQDLADKAQGGNVEAALDALARRTGRSPDDLLTDYINRKAGEPDEPRRGPDPATLALQKEVAAMRAERDRERQQYQQMASQQQFEQAVAHGVETLVAIPNSPEFARLWPAAASLPPHLLRDSARNLVADALQRSGGREVNLNDIAAALDRYAKPLQDHYRATGGPASGEPPAGNGTPAAANPGTAIRPAQQLTNKGAAATTTGRRELTQAEREAEADELAQGLARSMYGVDDDD